MKNQIYIIAFLFISIAVTLSSCKKFDFDRQYDEKESVQISNDRKEVNANETLLYVLPESFNKETPVISAQAASFATSTLEQDASTGNWTYKYVPKEGFTGSDQVVIDSDNESDEDRQKNGNKKCGDYKKESDSFRLVLDISVIGATANK